MSHVLILVQDSDPIKVFWKKVHTFDVDQLKTITETGCITLDSIVIRRYDFDTPIPFPIGKSTRVIVCIDDKQQLGIILNTDNPQDEYVRIQEIPYMSETIESVSS